MKRMLILLWLGGLVVGLSAQTLDNAARNREVVSTTHTGGVNEIAKILDGMIGTWAVFGSGNYTASFVLKFPFKYSFSLAKLYFNTGDLPYDIRIEGSANGSTYQTLANYVFGSYGMHTISLSNNSNLQYIRVSFNVTGNSNKTFNLQEFELIGSTSTRYDIGYDACGNRISTKVITLSSSRAKVEQADSISTSLPEPLVDNDLGEMRIELFPNPTSSIITLRLIGGESTGTMQYTLYDGQGRIVLGPTMFRGEAQVDLSRWPRGIYFMLLQTGERTSQWKIIKQ